MKSVSKVCKHCGVGFVVPNARKDTAQFCSRACSDGHPKTHNTVLCRECGTEFPRKLSEARKVVWGNFCSPSCMSSARSRLTLGDGNPNWKGRNFDSDGYKIFSPQASLMFGYGRVKVHQAVAMGQLGLTKIPKGLHVHHRDCDIQNNDPRNLQLLNASDHKWIHKQFGSATLWAIVNGKVDIDEASTWSDDPLRANTILTFDITSQSAVFKYLNIKFGVVDVARVVALKPVRLEVVEQ